MTNQKIDQAVAAARAKKKAVVLVETPVRITEEAILVSRSGELAFTRAEDADPTTANLLLWDPKLGAFRPILTPPGTSWELVERQQGPKLWQPGMKT